MKIIGVLCSFSPRQGENEISTAKYIESVTAGSNLSYTTDIFETKVPEILSAKLCIDNQEIPCLGSSFEGGQISKVSEINISPHSDFIETVTYTDHPSVYISRLYSDMVQKAQSISGHVSVQKLSYLSRNFLVGNNKNPQKIFFAHYDCLGGGAIDNAGSVAVLLDLIITSPVLIEDNLFVFCGNEELSYDKPDYWGKGYREFERKHPDLLESTKEIVIVDGVGVTSPIIINKNLDDVFPIKNLKNLTPKIIWISSDQKEVLKTYHCQEDTPDKLSEAHLISAYNLLLKLSK